MNKKLMKEYRARISELNAQFDQGIEKNRKEDADIRVVDREGKPIVGAHVSLHQKSHDFNFGCNGVQIGQKPGMNDYYEQEFAKLFNLVTTTVCWSVTETSEGHFRLTEKDGDMFRRPPLERIVSFADQYGLRVKGQPLLADGWVPEWASRDPETLKKQWSAFVRMMGETFGDKLDVWDVVNETLLCHGRSPKFPLLNDQLDYADWCFEEIARVFPEKHGILEINEASPSNYGKEAERYLNIVRRIRDKKLPVEQVGLQFHMFSGEEGLKHLRNELFPLDQILDTYRQVHETGLPWAITEITIPSRMKGFTDEEGELVQAEIATNLYRLWFSLPGINTITYWNFMDGLHWKSEGDCRGCLLDTEYREKPIYQALYQLIQRRWKTDVQLETDADGKVSLRGFCGDYDLTVEHDSLHLNRGFGIHHGADNQITITL